MSPPFDLQGHRGARGLKPENTLPSFETALDFGVTTVETDVHLTRDDIPVLIHDPIISDLLCDLPTSAPVPLLASRPAIRALSLKELQSYHACRNPDIGRFPDQEAAPTPVAVRFAAARGLDPYAPPTLMDLFLFADQYAGALGLACRKTDWQRQRAGQVQFDLEIKRIPFLPEVINDGFDGVRPALMEERVVTLIAEAGMMDRTIVRSFDHRSVLAIRRLAPAIRCAVLISGTAPVDPVGLVKSADAQIYCPDYLFIDLRQIKEAHEAGIRVVPWTVNTSEAWAKLLDWGVDGLTTDFPDRLGKWLAERGVAY